MSEHADVTGPLNGAETPRGNLAGFARYFKNDVSSGFLVFLIALPLCLAISQACGYPPIAGIFTAIVGSILTTFISNSEMTIKGPAAGLIVICIGCMQEFGGDGMLNGFTAADAAAYKAALAVGMAAAVLQIIFAVSRAGILGDFFPVSTVHGMLAAIGVIIISKQIPSALGVVGEVAKGEPLELLERVPTFIKVANPAIAAIGCMSLLIMFLWPLVGRKCAALKAVPAPLIVLLVAVPMGMGFDLLHPHSYVLQNHEYQLSDQYLVSMPDRPFGMFDNITLPDFSALKQPVAWKWVFMFFMIGSLESLLSAKAIDMIDPWKRKTNLDRDMLSVGTANLCSAFVGGLPMISEIVRSRANIDNGARTRFADMWHGIFLLACVALIPTVLHHIPLASLAAMLIYTGFRLAHPREFMHVYHIGVEQLLIFVSTLVGVLATDLLIGVIIGILVKAGLHVFNGVPVRSLFKPYIDVEMQDEKTALVRARHSAVFSNWILLRRQLVRLGIQDGLNVILDLSETKLVDHSVMGKLHELQNDFANAGTDLQVTGLEGHVQLSGHPQAARKQGRHRLRRVTVVTDSEIQQEILNKLIELGASGYTAIPCFGAGRTALASGNGKKESQVRLEVIVPEDIANEVLNYLRAEVASKHPVTACLETVEVYRSDQF